jgi:hypothetical protein
MDHCTAEEERDGGGRRGRRGTGTVDKNTAHISTHKYAYTYTLRI